MTPLPQAKSKCRSCGQAVFVRSGPDNARHLLRLDELEIFEATWIAERFGPEVDEDDEEHWRRVLVESWILTRQAVPARLRLLDFSSDVFEQEVVGESYNQAAIAEVASASENGPRRSDIVARLRPDPDNRKDKNAIAVEVFGRHVGYIPREIAADLAPLVAALDRQGIAVACRAEVRGGGWRRDTGERMSMGVFLAFDPDEDWVALIRAGEVREVTVPNGSEV